MKRKFFSTLLMGAFFIASMSMFTSCKDYDDDINGLKSDITTINSSLTQTKSDLEKEIASLKTQLEAKDAELTTLITKAQSTADANSASIAKEITRATAAEAALDARLKTAESALTSINTALAGKLDKTVFADSIKSIYGRLEAIQTNLGSALSQISDLKQGLNDEKIAREAVAADLAQQKSALAGYLTRLQALENAGYVTSAGVKTIVDAQIASLKANELKAITDRITALESKVKDLDVATITKQLQSLSNDITKLQSEIDDLNVLIEKSLRSLVFIPESYYYGIEATKLLYLEFNSYYLDEKLNPFPVATYDKKEAKGYDDDIRYYAKEGTKVLSFAATYHMNPSSADLKDASVSVLSNDLAFVTDGGTRSAACGLSVKNWSVAGGDLTVNLDVTDPSLIKSVGQDQMVTNFAAQVKLNKVGTTDTTITSDYATLYKFVVKDLKLGHKKSTETNPVPLYTDAAVSALSPCDVVTAHGHLMQTVHEAGVTFASQDSCNWNETLDLRKLVETHYTGVDGSHAVLTDAAIAANFDYKFELTYFSKGANATDESAHAAIATDGYTFRPQSVSADGKQQVYGADQNRASEVGRTPIVRVSLIDKATGKVYDYGYIRINITEKKADTPVKADKFISYTGLGYSNSGECTPLGWSYQTTWAVTEADLYKELGLTRTEFEANYGAPVGDVDDLTQFSMNKDGVTFTQIADANKIGTASTVTDKTPSGDGEMSSTLKWEMTSAQAYKFFITDKKAGTGVAIKYESKDKTVGPDVYVYFKTGATVAISTPSATVAWAKNSTVWAATNASAAGTGLNEIHVNVPSVEDGKTTVAKPFEQIFSNVFTGNTISTSIITNIVDKTASKDYAANKLKLDLIFDASNNGKKYIGVSGKTYVMSVSSDSKTLFAKIDVKDATATQAVAVIGYTGEVQDVNHEKVSYQETEFAKDLLNYKSHNALDNNTIKAIVGLTAVNACNKALPLTNNTFDVRFLRPINITNTTAEVEDAATTALQTIDLMKLLTFTDWRDAWKSGYETYYGITGVSVQGVADGDKISTNLDVLTDQNGNVPMVSLANVNGAIDFTYSSANKGTLTYRNYNSTTADFKVQIPVIVSYIWGDVPQTITVSVKHTHSNAKKY